MEQSNKFYNELFDLIHNIMPVMHMTMISKLGLYIRRFFQNVSIDWDGINQEFFYYSFTKFVTVYGTEQLRNELLSIQTQSDMNRFVDSIIYEIKNIITATSDMQIPLKQHAVSDRTACCSASSGTE